MHIIARILPGDMLLADAAREAVCAHLHLVITERGQVVLTPILLPGMQRIAVNTDKRQAA